MSRKEFSPALMGWITSPTPISHLGRPTALSGLPYLSQYIPNLRRRKLALDFLSCLHYPKINIRPALLEEQDENVEKNRLQIIQDQMLTRTSSQRKSRRTLTTDRGYRSWYKNLVRCRGGFPDSLNTTITSNPEIIAGHGGIINITRATTEEGETLLESSRLFSPSFRDKCKSISHKTLCWMFKNKRSYNLARKCKICKWNIEKEIMIEQNCVLLRVVENSN